MTLTSKNELKQAKSEKFQGDGFVIEKNIIRSEEKFYDVNGRSVAEIILNSLEGNPQLIGQIDAVSEKIKTYKDLKERFIRLAIWLKNEGIGPGDIVTVCGTNHSAVQTIIFGTIFIGATYSAFYHGMNLSSARRNVKLVKPRVVFAHKSNVDVLQEAAVLENHAWKLIVFGEDCNRDSLSDILQVPSADEIKSFTITTDVNPKNLCMIAPTSGSTGAPKFVSYSYEKIMLYMTTIAKNNVCKGTGNTVLTHYCPEWGIYFRAMIESILTEQTEIFHGDFEPHAVCRVIEKYKVKKIYLDTYKFLLLCHADVLNKYDVQSVSTIIPVGSKLSIRAKNKMRKIFPNAFICVGFGLSETFRFTKYTKKCRNPESEGTVIPNVQLKITDLETGLSVGTNVVGELCVKVPYIMNGYYKDPAQTQLAFDDEGWFHSGDDAYYDENGEIIFVGRLKEMIKYRGCRFYATPVEQMLLSHPNIIDAAVISIPNDLYVERPVAYVKIAPKSKVSEADILKLTCELDFSDTFKGSVIFIDEMPRLTSGKINKRILRQHAEKFYKSD